MFLLQKLNIHQLLVVLLLVMGLWFGVHSAKAAINDQIHFQGKVVNSDGTNVTNGDYSFTFTIYDASSAGTNLWTETKTITVTDGIFATDLGSVTDLPGSIDFNTESLYLGVNFNSDGEMSPRIRLTAVPYAFNAEKVAGLTVTDTTGTLTIPDATIAFSGNNDVTFTSTAATSITLPTTGTLATLAGTETFSNKTIANTGLVVADTGWIGLGSGAGRISFTDSTTDSILLRDANVGIGTTSTGARMSVVGITNNANIAEFIGERDGSNINMYFKHNSTADVNNSARLTFQLNTTTQARTAFEFISGFADVTDASRTSITHFAGSSNGSYGNRMTLYGTDLGIGTESPTARLDINGTASTSATLSFRGTTDPMINILNGENFGISTSPGGNAGLTERLTLRSNGNVGIGSTNPSSFKLEVAGDIGPEANGTRSLGSDTKRWANIYTSQICLAGDCQTSWPEGGGTNYWSKTGTNIGMATAGDDLYLASGELLGVGYDPTTLSNGVAAFSGNVGIGTSGPTAILDVLGSGSNIATFRSNVTASGSPGAIVEYNYNTSTTLGRVGVVNANAVATYYMYAGATRQIGLGANSSTTPHLLINTSGNVGIGTTVPGSLLNVAGYISAPAATFSATYAGGTPLTLKAGPSATTNILSWQNSAGSSLGFINQSGNLGIGTTSATASIFTRGTTGITSDLSSNTANTPFFTGSHNGSMRFQVRFDAAGNIQFLTNDPGDNSNGNYFIQKDGESYARAVFARSYLGFGPGTSSRDVYVERSATNTILISSGGGGTGHLHVTGNVGIGTTSPSTKLDVAGYIKAPAATFSANYAGGTALTLRAGPTATTNIMTWQNSSGTVLGVIDESGNIGIGSTDPGFKLEVAGGASFNNNSIVGVDSITISDPGPGEGMSFGNTTATWKMDVTPLDRSNGDGNLNLYGTSDNIALWRPSLWVYDATNYTTATTQSSGGLDFTTTSTGHITFNPGGNVGVGTTSPAAFKLEVAGNIGPEANNTRTLGTDTKRWSSVHTTELCLSGDCKTAWPTGGTGDSYWSKTGTNVGMTTAGDDLYLASGELLGAGYDPTTLSGVVAAFNGNVGIGTSTADSKLEVLSGDTTRALQVIGDSVTTGEVIDISADGLTTGYAMNLSSTSNSLSTGGLLDLDWSPSAVATSSGDLFRISLGAHADLTGNLLGLYDSGSSIFLVGTTKITSAVPHEFTASGDVSIAYDIVLTNQTASEIQSYGPLTIRSGEIFENLDITLDPSGTGGVVVADNSDLKMYADQKIILDADDSANSYIQFDNTNNRVEIFADNSERFRFTASGNNESNGTITTTLSDLAENYPTMNENLEPGDIVMITEQQSSAPAASLVDTATADLKQNVLGVVSSKPGIVLGGSSFLSDICEEVSASASGKLSQHLLLLQTEYKQLKFAELEGQQRSASNSSELQENIDQALADELAIMTIEDLVQALPPTTIKTVEDRLSSCEAVKQVPVALAGRVPVKFDPSQGAVQPGDLLTVSSSNPGAATKAKSAGWVIGKALSASSADSETVMMFVTISWYGGESSLSTIGRVLGTSDVTLTTELNDVLSINSVNGEEFLVSSRNLSVFGSMTAETVAATNKILTGMLSIGGINNEITTVNGSALKLQSGFGAGNIEIFNKKLLFTSDGGVIAEDQITAKRFAASDDSRGSVYATSNRIKVDQKWKTAPASITLTPEYRADVWVSDITKDGFYINTEPPSANKKIFWWAIW